MIKDLCSTYSLPHPLQLLDCPLPQASFKKFISSRILDVWQQKLRKDASSLKSLAYFKPEFLSLTKSHPIWTTCGSNSFEINKAITQARMLSGRFRTQELCKYFSNKTSGFCLICPPESQTSENIEHILVYCKGLDETRARVLEMWYQKLKNYPAIQNIMKGIMESCDAAVIVQFLLDCSVVPAIIEIVQANGEETLEILFHLTRTWCHSVNISRLKKLGRYHK